MSDYDDLIKRVQPYYSDLPSGGMMVLDELVNAIRDLEVKVDDQHTELVEAQKALDIVRILANTPPNEWLRKSEIHAGLAEFRFSLSGENSK